jgi:FlaA1/EpsC-like NDP-sugar epimerase
MTTREAVQLVLQASTMGKESEIFVLDMGEPVKIVDLARNMIRLAGLEPEEDVEIRFVGLRPGEKLFEELLTEGEDIQPTYHDKIKIFQGSTPHPKEMELWVRGLRSLVESRDETEVVAWLAKLVPEYRPGGIWAGIRSVINESARMADAS